MSRMNGKKTHTQHIYKPSEHLIKPLRWEHRLPKQDLFSVLVANSKKLLSTVANPGRGLLTRKEEKNKGNLAAQPPPPTLLVRRKKIKKIVRRIYMPRRYVGLGPSRRPYKDSFDSSARPMGIASQNSTLPCATTCRGETLLYRAQSAPRDHREGTEGAVIQPSSSCVRNTEKLLAAERWVFVRNISAHFVLTSSVSNPHATRMF